MEARGRRPLIRVTVPPRLARFLIAAGGQPTARTHVLAEDSLRAGPELPAVPGRRLELRGKGADQRRRQDAKRMADFAAGLIFGLGGSIEPYRCSSSPRPIGPARRKPLTKCTGLEVLAWRHDCPFYSLCPLADSCRHAVDE